MSTDEYEAITEAEWKVLATTEITHLTDEEKDYLPRAWDEWIARVRRDAWGEGEEAGYVHGQHDAHHFDPGPDYHETTNPYDTETGDSDEH